jgi:hypothetical protein
VPINLLANQRDGTLVDGSVNQHPIQTLEPPAATHMMLHKRICSVGGVIIGAARDPTGFPFCVAGPRHCASLSKGQSFGAESQAGSFFSTNSAIDGHLTVRSGWQVDQSIQGKVLVISETAIVQAPETLDACGLVTGEEEAVADPCDGGEILVERIL